MTPDDGAPAAESGRAGIVLFDPPESAPDLHEIAMMSMLTLDPPAPDQMMEGIQILEFRGVSSFDMQITGSQPRWDRIVDTVRAGSAAWKEAAPHA